MTHTHHVKTYDHLTLTLTLTLTLHQGEWNGSMCMTQSMKVPLCVIHDCYLSDLVLFATSPITTCDMT